MGLIEVHSKNGKPSNGGSGPETAQGIGSREPKTERDVYGPELISQTLADWAAEHDVALAFIQPGKPAQNAFIERFNRTYREAVLDALLFHTVAEVQAITEDRLEEYYAIRPHEALGDVPPNQYALKQP